MFVDFCVRSCNPQITASIPYLSFLLIRLVSKKTKLKLQSLVKPYRIQNEVCIRNFNKTEDKSFNL